MKCIVCGTDIPPKRIEILGPSTNTCVNHSTANKKVGIPVTLGQGDHTYTELNIMEQETYEKLEKLKRNSLAL